jgi:hypothetical protein
MAAWKILACRVSVQKAARVTIQSPSSLHRRMDGASRDGGSSSGFELVGAADDGVLSLPSEPASPWEEVGRPADDSRPGSCRLVEPANGDYCVANVPESPRGTSPALTPPRAELDAADTAAVAATQPAVQAGAPHPSLLSERDGGGEDWTHVRSRRSVRRMRRERRLGAVPEASAGDGDRASHIRDARSVCTGECIGCRRARAECGEEVPEEALLRESTFDSWLPSKAVWEGRFARHNRRDLLRNVAIWRRKDLHERSFCIKPDAVFQSKKRSTRYTSISILRMSLPAQTDIARCTREQRLCPLVRYSASRGGRWAVLDELADLSKLGQNNLVHPVTLLDYPCDSVAEDTPAMLLEARPYANGKLPFRRERYCPSSTCCGKMKMKAQRVHDMRRALRGHIKHERGLPVSENEPPFTHCDECLRVLFDSSCLHCVRACNP